MQNKDSINTIKEAISQNDISAALRLLRIFLDDSPKLTEAIHHSGRFQYIRQQIRLGTISQAEATLTQNQIRFGLLDLLNEIEQEGVTTLPVELAENLITDKSSWLESLRFELRRQGIAVGKRPPDVIQHFGWLIEEFLRKMLTAEGQERNLRALSFMTEAWQSTLRYLCHIQVAQILNMDKKIQSHILSEFVTLRTGTGEASEAHFDYLNLLLASTDILASKCFMPEISEFVKEITDTKSDLYGSTLYLDKYRRSLLKNAISEDEFLPQRVDEYLTALVYWLRKLVFLSKYRLVSIKDISLNYRIGTSKNFIHLYGELHGVYSESLTAAEDYKEKSVEGAFTFNQSVLLFKGNNAEACLDNISDEESYLSLSPLVIDQSVFTGKPTQTPEIFYYNGYKLVSRYYEFAMYRNELIFGNRTHLPSNKTLCIRSENIQQPRFNELFEHLELLFKPFLIPNL